jgi:hypothetical protein
MRLFYGDEAERTDGIFGVVTKISHGVIWLTDIDGNVHESPLGDVSPSSNLSHRDRRYIIEEYKIQT